MIVDPMRALQISQLLQECFLRTETECVRECCGLEAFRPDDAVIHAWSVEVGQERTKEAIREIRGLISESEERSVVVSSAFLNACTPTEDSREKLLAFLRAYEAALARCI